MSRYYEQSKSDGEAITYKGHISHWLLIWLAVKGLTIMILLIIFDKIGINAFRIPLNFAGLNNSIGLSGVLTVVIFFWYLLESTRVIIYVFCTDIILTNKRLILKSGLIFRNTQELRITRIEGSSLSQTLIERVIGIGTLRVNGIGSESVIVGKIQDPIFAKKSVSESANV